MGGKPSKGTTSDKRLKENQRRTSKPPVQKPPSGKGKACT